MKELYEYIHCARCGTAFFKTYLRLDGKEKKCPVCGHVGPFANVPEEENKPKWETPEQWEKRTGRVWQEDWSVYYRFRPCLSAELGAWIPWQVDKYKNAKGNFSNDIMQIVCATGAPPPDDWRPEEEL